MGFGKDDFLKIIDVNGDYHYGFIKEATEKGLHLLVCLHEEGSSALAYETESGAMVPDWDKTLSDTEKRIIKLLACETATKDIAVALDLAPATVRAHIRTLRLKLQLDNRLQLVAFAHGMAKILLEQKL